jgi:hypothetical protein
MAAAIALPLLLLASSMCWAADAARAPPLVSTALSQLDAATALASSN